MTARGGRGARVFWRVALLVLTAGLCAGAAMAADKVSTAAAVGGGDEATPRYFGTKISLDFQEADVTTVLRLIA